MDKTIMNAIVFLPIAFLGGWVGYKLKIPAGTLIFSLLAVAGVKLLMKFEVGTIPTSINFITQSLIGVIIGSQFNRNVLEEISKMWGYMLFSVLMLVVAGAIATIILIKWNILNLPTAYLSTSPGALSAIIFLAVDQGISAPTVAVFHLTRVFFILLTGPIVLKIIEYLK